MGYLLDTNMVSDLVRHPQGSVTQAIQAVGEGEVSTSFILAAELRYGATKRASPEVLGLKEGDRVDIHVAGLCLLQLKKCRLQNSC